MNAVREAPKWRVNFKVEKYDEDIAPFEAEGREAEFHALFQPHEVIEREGNLLLNEGIDLIWDLVTGAGGTAYNNANARIGVGDSTAAAAATQTDLQAAVNKLYKGQEATFPTSTVQQVTFKSSFGGTEANFAWNEWSVDNGALAGINLNRKVEALGTKVGGTWTLTVTITLA